MCATQLQGLSKEERKTHGWAIKYTPASIAEKALKVHAKELKKKRAAIVAAAPGRPRKRARKKCAPKKRAT